MTQESPQTINTDEDTRTRLLNAAGPVFADKGFQGATVREICEAAEVNIASVNYHFGDKQRLYIETVKRAHQLRTMRTPLPRWPAGTPADLKLRDFIRTLLTRMIATDEAPWQHRLMMQEILNPAQACREMVEDYIRPEFQRLLSILEELLPAGGAAGAAASNGVQHRGPMFVLQNRRGGCADPGESGRVYPALHAGEFGQPHCGCVPGRIGRFDVFHGNRCGQRANHFRTRAAHFDADLHPFRLSLIPVRIIR